MFLSEEEEEEGRGLDLFVLLELLFIKYSDPIKVSGLHCISFAYLWPCLHRKQDDTRLIKRWWQNTGGSTSICI